MPVYGWRCKSCDHTTEVFRSMADIELGPDEGCEKCASRDVYRPIARPDNVKGFILADNGYGWPSHGFYSRKITSKD